MHHQSSETLPPKSRHTASSSPIRIQLIVNASEHVLHLTSKTSERPKSRQHYHTFNCISATSPASFPKQSRTTHQSLFSTLPINLKHVPPTSTKAFLQIRSLEKYSSIYGFQILNSVNYNNTQNQYQFFSSEQFIGILLIYTWEHLIS